MPGADLLRPDLLPLARSLRRGLRWLPPAQLIAAEAVAKRLLAEPVLRDLRGTVDPHRAALDVGGYHGTYAYWLARWTHQVFVFEPNPALAELLRRGLPENCEVVQAAAAATAGEAALHIPLTARGPVPSRGSLLPSERSEAVRVECRPIDSLALPPTGFVKIDVEGAERDVIEGASALIERDRPVLLVEIEERWSRSDPLDFVREIEAWGYDAWFFFAGRWVPAGAFSLERHQRSFLRGASRHYGNNFLFLPRAEGGDGAHTGRHRRSNAIPPQDSEREPT